jgi:hypothetical protein
MNPGNYFTKLNLDFSDANVDNLVLNFGYGFYGITNDKTQVFKVFFTEDEFQDYIKSKLPESFRSWIRRVRVLVMTSPGIPPHKDYNLQTAINFYSIPGNATTTFWSTVAGAKTVPHPLHPDEPTAALVAKEDLIKECSVVFGKNSCYLLNVSEIHDVDIEKDCVRKVIQLTFNPDVTYNMVLDKLNELNLVEDIK